MNGNELLLVLFRATASVHGLGVLAGAVESSLIARNTNFTICTSLDELIKTAITKSGSYRFVVICWSFHSPDVNNIKEMLNAFRHEVTNRNIKNIAGGPHCTARPEQTLNFGFDYVFCGESEESILAFLQWLLRSEDLKGDEGVPIDIARSGRIIRSTVLVDLDKFPPFAPGLGLFGPIEVTRGCIFGCRFCQTSNLFGRKFRHRSLDSVAYYVKLMAERGLKDIRFLTPSAFSYGARDAEPNIEMVEALLSRVKSITPAGTRFYYGTFPSEVRPEHVSHAALKVLKRYVSNRKLIIGAQSGSNTILRAANRHYEVDLIIEAVRVTKEAGFVPVVDFIFGFPDETEREFGESIAVISKLVSFGAEIHAHYFLPLPGTDWQYRKAAVLPNDIVSRLGALASRGVLFGQWQRQVKISNQLSNQNGEEEAEI